MADKPKEDKKEEPKPTEEVELSEEDQKLKDDIDMMVERIRDRDQNIQKTALESIKKEVCEATSSMTSVPKPLKFLQPHYVGLKEYYNEVPDSDFKK